MSDTQAQEAARMAEWHRDQALQWRRAAAFEAADHPEPTRSMLTRKSDTHVDAADLIERQAARIAELESRVHTCGPTCSKAGCINRRLAAEVEALRAELDAHRLYARQLCKAIDAATDFAGTVAGGASWWDDVWAEHHSALDRAREGISAAIDQLKEQK